MNFIDLSNCAVGEGTLDMVSQMILHPGVWENSN